MSIRSTVRLRNMDNHQGHGCKTKCFRHRIMLTWNTWTTSQMTELSFILAPALCCRWSSCDISSSWATFCARRRINPLTFACCASPPTGEDLQGDRKGPSPTKSRKLTPQITCLRMTMCALQLIAQDRAKWRGLTYCRLFLSRQMTISSIA